jgi:hypothetical protein
MTINNGITLTASEIREITGKTRYAAQIRALERLHIPVKPRPDGSPCVFRTAASQVMGVQFSARDQITTIELDLAAL